MTNQRHLSILDEIKKSGGDLDIGKPNDSVMLIDGMNLFIRVFSAIPTTNDDGIHIGGIVGFLRSLAFNINMIRPTRTIIVFDGKGGSNRRRKIFPEYKAGRKMSLRLNRFTDVSLTREQEHKMMIQQLNRVIEYLECLPLTITNIPNIEADDVIGYASKHCFKDKCTIMSTDKDFLQLVDDRIRVWSPTKKKMYDEERILDEYGINASNFLLYRVLDGDKSDDIPGVRGIGVKTLIKEFPLLVEDREFNTKDLLDMAKSRNTRISKIIQDNELIIKRNYLLMQLGNPDIKNQTKLKIGDSVRGIAPKLVKYQLQTLFVKDKLWGQIPNFDNRLTEFNILDHYWKNKK